MVTLFTGVRVAVVCAIKAIDTIVDIVAGVGVHNVDNDEQAETVRLINQVFEVVWVSLT